MNNSMKFWRWFLALALLVSGNSSRLCGQVQKRRIVIVMSLDGFPAYALDDPRLPIPTLRKLMREGTAAASMRPINPTVTWPNHTALVTGVDASEHHVLYNGLLTRPSADAMPVIEPWRDRDVMVHAPTVYDVAYNAGLTTAQVDWVAIYGAKTISWKFPELPDPNGVIERELIADGTATAEQLEKFEAGSQAWQDQMWTDAAIKILEKHTPSLLLFHLLSLDNANHEYGPMSEPSLTAMAFLDDRVKQLLDALQRNGLTERTTLIIVSDHGARKIQYKLHPNALLREKGFIREANGKTEADAWGMSAGIGMIYAMDGPKKKELIPQLHAAFSGAEGVESVYEAKDFSALGFPLPSESDQAPDLIVIPKQGYAFSGDPDKNYVTQVSEGGTHGFLNTDPQMQAIFIAWGANIPKGVHLNAISNLDVAPTIAALLGLEMKQAKGQAIPEIVKVGHRN